MNPAQRAVTPPCDKQSADQLSLVDLIIVLAKHKKIILGFPLAVALSAALISFVLPNVYKAGTKLLPPQQSQSGAAALLSQLGGAAAGLTGMKNQNDLYVGMLKSRTVADRLISQFNLRKVYGTASQDAARNALERNTTIISSKDGLITIEVEDGDQKLVAKLANSYVDELLKLTRVLAVTEASQRRVFFERQLELAKNNLATAEVSLKHGLDTHGVTSVDSESIAVVETIGRVRAQISAKEIELSSMQAFVTATNPEYLRVSEELKSLRAELSKLQNGSVADAISQEAPDAKRGGLDNIKLLRDVKYYQMLYELLAKQYEIARLDEAKEPSIVQVLDPAIEPERRFKPKRALIVIFSTIFALLLAGAWVYILESKQKMLNTPGGAGRWKELRSSLRIRSGQDR